MNTQYIENLQQQIYFMELELNILKQKCIEDEKDTGIGGIFEDEKTSHEHISLLKTKYQQMRKDAEITNQDNDRRKMEIMGEKFMLAAQLENNRSTMQDAKRRVTEQSETHMSLKFNLEKKVKDE